MEDSAGRTGFRSVCVFGNPLFLPSSTAPCSESTRCVELNVLMRKAALNSDFFFFSPAFLIVALCPQRPFGLLGTSLHPLLYSSWAHSFPTNWRVGEHHTANVLIEFGVVFFFFFICLLVGGAVLCFLIMKYLDCLPEKERETKARKTQKEN